MDSPLTQQLRPDSFEPKIVQLYLYLFNVLANDDDVDDTVPSEGFWREFFILKPDKQKLYGILEPMTADDLLHIRPQTQRFFQRAVSEAGSSKSPVDENALENLSGFLSAVFTKKYTNPSTDIIDVLAGLDQIDSIMSDLVNSLETIVRQGTKTELQSKAIVTALAMVSGGFQTSLVTYFMHRDLFPAVMKFIHDHPDFDIQPFNLLGTLANYNKFESQNIYNSRLEDFVNEETIRILTHDIGKACQNLRNEYVAIQDDSPIPWSINSTLSLVGLRSLSPDAKKPPPPSEEEAKVLFNALPDTTASVLLSVFTFVQANNLFASNLISLPAERGPEAPFSTFLSSTSYLAQHAFRSTRAANYALLNLLTIRNLVEDTVFARRICSSEIQISVRLCRQRPPHLPHISTARIPATVILDVCADTMSHNLRKRIDVNLYSLVLGIILRLTANLESTKNRLQYHWAYIWGSLMSLLRFLTQYFADLKYVRGVKEDLCSTLTNLIAFCLSNGDAFLPDPSSYDDLFYKIVEAADTLTKFKQAYCDSNSNTEPLSKAVTALISVSSHYHGLLKAQHGKKVHQSPEAIQKVIKEGYETLNLENDQGFGAWERWRESNWKAELKKIIRTAVEDSKFLALK